MDSPLNRVHWWSIVVEDAAQLTDVLNEADRQGLELHVIVVNPPEIIVVLKALITTENLGLLTKGFTHAKKEKACTTLPTTGKPIHATSPLANAVGKVAERQRGNRGAQDKPATKPNGHSPLGSRSGVQA